MLDVIRLCLIGARLALTATGYHILVLIAADHHEGEQVGLCTNSFVNLYAKVSNSLIHSF